MRLFSLRVILFSLAVILPWSAFAAAAPPLFSGGATVWCIRHDAAAGATLKYAAEELQTTLQAISGATLPIVTDGATEPAIVLAIAPDLTANGEIAVKLDNGALRLSGGSELAVLHAVYAFLQEQLEVRWLWPGDDGTFIKRQERWEMPNLDYRYQPPIRFRGLHLCGDWREVTPFRTWMARNFINIHRHGHHGDNKMFHVMLSNHNVRLPKELLATKPEWFALLQGQRYDSQMCFSQLESAEFIAQQVLDKLKPEVEILSLFPADNVDYCQCQKCSEQGTTTTWFAYYNQLTDHIRARRPGLELATIAYQGYRDVPQVEIKPSIFIEYASHTRCHVHTLDDPSCERNRQTMADMMAWQKTGMPIGHYAYEFDTFRQSPFMPFFTMLGDAVRTSARLKHVALLTEVSLSPRHATPEQAYAVRNRLPIWLYAQLLWKPEAKVQKLLQEWCQNAYREAAEPMLEYLLAFDQAWSKLPKHCSILGQAATVAPDLLTPELQAKASKAFQQADQALQGKINHNVEREKILFQQWVNLLGNEHEMLAPLLKDAPTSEQGSAPTPGIGVKVAWTQENLYFSNWHGALEVALSTGLGGETWHFAVDQAGQPQAWRVSAVGIKDARWQPKWQFADHTACIPFTTLGRAPTAGEVWAVRLRQEQHTFPPTGESFAGLRFCPMPVTNRTVLWWSGRPERDDQELAARRRQFAEAGWQFVVGKADNLTQAKPQVYWFRNPGYAHKPPLEAWPELRQRITDGATAVFVSYARMPLEEYFADQSFRVAVREIKGLPLTARRVRWLADGDWRLKPHNLGNLGISPAYGLDPEQIDAWQVLATMPYTGEEPEKTLPFIICRPYGKGKIVVTSDRVAVTPVNLLENFLQMTCPATAP